MSSEAGLVVVGRVVVERVTHVLMYNPVADTLQLFFHSYFIRNVAEDEYDRLMANAIVGKSAD